MSPSFYPLARSRNRCEIEENIPPRTYVGTLVERTGTQELEERLVMGRGTSTELWWKRKEEAGNGSESRERVAVRSSYQNRNEKNQNSLGKEIQSRSSDLRRVRKWQRFFKERSRAEWEEQRALSLSLSIVFQTFRPRSLSSSSSSPERPLFRSLRVHGRRPPHGYRVK